MKMKSLDIWPSFARHLPLLFVGLLQYPHLLVADNLTAGAILAPPSYITCPSGEFAFGFLPLNSEPSRFLLAIWFNFNLDSAQQRVVWYAKDQGASPVKATAQSVFSVTPTGQLSLDTTGNNIWTNSKPAQYGSVLMLQDSGNLQLLADGSTVVWESFQNPTDTLLPGQSLGTGGILLSKFSDTDFSPGRFSLNVQDDGNTVLYIVNIAAGIQQVDLYNAYWGTMKVRSTHDGNTTLFFDSPGYVYFQIKGDTAQYQLLGPLANSTISYHQFATLDPDGMVRVYTLPKNATDKNNMSWAVAGMFPTEGCRTAAVGMRQQGLCGPNSYCVYGPNGRLDCECPKGYSFVDAQRSYRGCTPAFLPQSCEGNRSAEFEIVKMQNTNWTNRAYDEAYSTVEQCSDSCLADCLCTAALFDGNNCGKMTSLTGLGWQEGNMNMTVLIKVRTSSPSTQVEASQATRRKILPYVLLGCSTFLLLGAVSGLVLQLYRTKKNNSHDFVRVFTEKELHNATNGFSRLLGRGGFGEVYHGVVMSLHPPEIAVKKLISSNEYSEREFANEVQSIGKIHHRNLVRMVGYCKERQQRMLVFEFMPGGSLRSFLFQPQRPQWRWRADAAVCIAKGLEYLHEGCSSPIIHCDIKLDNILLDEKNSPKITDFGIARLLSSDQQMLTTITNVRGTRGYIAPEWFQSDMRIDTKVDVYSFGVVLLEMICCRKCLEPVTGQEGDDSLTLFGWAGQLICDGRVEVMLHDDDDAVEDLAKVERFSRVAFWCIEQNPSLRPTMHQVVQMLEGVVVELDTLPDPRSADSLPLISSVDGITSPSSNYS